jgi:integrase
MTDLELRASGGGLTPVDLERIGAAVEAARSQGTRRTYNSAWRSWEKWCAERKVEPLPADPVMLAAHLAERHGDGVSTSRLTVTVSAIRARHLDAGLDDPTAIRGVILTMAGLRRVDAGETAPRQAHPLSTEQVRRMVDGLDRSTLAGKRDAAIILLGFAAALRRSEIAALRVADLSWKSEGVVVRIRKSKRDQDGAGAHVGVVRGHGSTDPVAALHDWVNAAGLDRGDPVFVRLRRGGRLDTGRPLTGEAVNLIVQRAARRAGLADLPISAHSLRAGHATVAAEAGVPVDRLARTGRWADHRTLAAYVRPASSLQDSTSGALGL